MRKQIRMSSAKRFLISSAYNLRAVARNIVHIPRNINRIKEILLSQHIHINQQEYFLSIVVTIKNESKYMNEWLDYHLMVGVDHFYIYDNGSTDDLEKILKPYVMKGIVTYINWEGENQQLIIYENALRSYQYDTTWMAILDADEFLVSVTEQSIIQFLKSLDNNIAQVILGWMVFGSSGHKKYKKGLVLERFKMHAKNSWIADGKPIVRPNLFLKVPFPHWVDVFGKTINENGECLIRYPQIDIATAYPMSKAKFRINHYYSKSWEEFQEKRNRGFADRGSMDRTLDDFLDHDQNVISDTLVDDVVRRLKEKYKIK